MVQLFGISYPRKRHSSLTKGNIQITALTYNAFVENSSAIISLWMFFSCIFLKLGLRCENLREYLVSDIRETLIDRRVLTRD